MGTRMEKDTILEVKFPVTNVANTLAMSNGCTDEMPEEKRGSTRVRDKLSTTNITRSFAPLVKSLLESLKSTTLYLARYTLEIIKPLIKMKEGLRNRK